MPELTLSEIKAVQDLETQHRQAISVIGKAYQYLNFVLVHPAYSDQPDAQKLAAHVLSLMDDEVGE